MSEHEILCSDLLEVAEIMDNDGYSYFGNRLREAEKLIKEQQRKIYRLTLENKLIRQNCQGLEEQREAFAMKIEEMATEMKRTKEGG